MKVNHLMAERERERVGLCMALTVSVSHTWSQSYTINLVFKNSIRLESLDNECMTSM